VLELNLVEEKFASSCVKAMHFVGDEKIELRKLVKIVFIADLLARNEAGRHKSLTGMVYIADKLGPVPSRDSQPLPQREMLEAYCAKHSIGLEIVGDLVVRSRANTEVITDSDDFKFIGTAARQFHKYTADELSAITHQFPAWFKTPLGDVISDELMTRLFRIGDPEEM